MAKARFTDEASMRQVPLIAMYNENQVTYDESGRMTGVYLNIQVDQSDVGIESMLDNEGMGNRFLDTHTNQHGEVSHVVWYSKEQFDAMRAVSGEPVRGATDRDVNAEPGRIRNVDKYALGFTADVMSEEKDGRVHMVVCTPKSLEGVMDEAERARIEEYNKQHPMGTSPHVVTQQRFDEYDSYQLKNVDKYGKVGQFDGYIERKEAFKGRFFDNVADDAFLEDHIADARLGKRIHHGLRWHDADITDDEIVDVNAGVRHMFDRDGRFYPIDYNVALDDDALRAACAQHDGFMIVNAEGNVNVVHTKDADDLAKQLGEYLRSGVTDRTGHYPDEVVWFDSKERSIDIEKNHPELLPSEQYKTWGESIRDYQGKLKDRFGIGDDIYNPEGESYAPLKVRQKDVTMEQVSAEKAEPKQSKEPAVSGTSDPVVDRDSERVAESKETGPAKVKPRPVKRNTPKYLKDQRRQAGDSEPKGVSINKETKFASSDGEVVREPVSEPKTEPTAMVEYKQDQPLLAVWSDKDTVYDDKGNVKGVMVDFQVDQSNKTVEDAKAGRVYPNPSIRSAYGRNPEQQPKKTFCSKEMMDLLKDIGKTAVIGKMCGCSFTGTVALALATHAKEICEVCFPKNKNKALEGYGNAAVYDQYAQIKPSVHETFTAKDLRNHMDVTAVASENTKESMRAKDLELERAFAAPVAQPALVAEASFGY